MDDAIFFAAAALRWISAGIITLGLVYEPEVGPLLHFVGVGTVVALISPRPTR